MSGPGLSQAEVLARAAWLVEAPLLETALAGAPARECVFHLLRQVYSDEAAARRASERLGVRADLLDALDALPRAAFELRQGLPSLRGGRLARDIARLVDLDALAPLHPDLRWQEGAAVSWCRRADADDRALTHVLATGTVDTHVHLGGALPPGFNWIALMSGFVALGSVAHLPQARVPARRTEWVRAAARGMRLRLRLARALLAQGDARTRRRLAHLPSSDDVAWEGVDAELGTLATLDLVARVRRAVGHRPNHAEAFHDVLLPAGVTGEAGPLPDAGENDLLQLAARHLRRARDNGAADPLAADLRAYLRLRNAFYRAWRHDHGAYGLLRFSEAARRQSVLADRRRGRWQARRRQRQRREFLRFERQRLALSVAVHLFQCFEPADRAAGRVTRGLELRVSLWAGSSALHRLRAWMQGLDDAFGLTQRLLLRRLPQDVTEPLRPDPLAREVSPFQVGLVVHALKDPRQTRDTAALQARPLRQVLRSYPDLRRFLVGFDAANRERDTPPRVFSAAFHELRTLSDGYRARATEPPLHLGFTYHAGEDPWDLLTGLRHMDEAFVLLLGGRGRIGHGLALGDDPWRFYDRRDRCEPTLGAHLLDLVWAWGRLSRAGDPGALTVRARLEHVAGAACGPRGPRLEACWRRMGLADEGGEKVLQEDELMRALGFRGDAAQPVDVPRDELWLELLGRLQVLLRARLAGHVTLEANPTSNLLIGDYRDYDELPYVTLVEAGLSLSLNTDNPGMFATTLPTEFQRMQQALRAQRSAREAGAWLEARARDGRASSFLGVAPHGREAWLWARALAGSLRYATPTD